VTASADGSVRVWNMEDKETQHTDKLNYMAVDNDRMFFICELYHPSYVYGAKIHPARDDSTLFIATACFDQKVRIWSVNIEYGQGDCLDEVSINQKAAMTLGTKKSIYEYEENLEDETLRLIMNPQDTPDDIKNQYSPTKSTAGNSTEREKAINKGYKNLMEKKHPNALVFDNDGRLFVGDSHGQINVWRVYVDPTQSTKNMVKIADHFLIKHKEIEGDQINELIMHPESKNQLYVHSRDNCIRLIDYETSRGTRIKKRFFGSKCSNYMI